MNPYRQPFCRATRHCDHPNGFEDLSPGLPESARATPGTKFNPSITFARNAGAQRVYRPAATIIVFRYSEKRVRKKHPKGRDICCYLLDNLKQKGES